MTVIINGTTGVTFPNGVTMSDGTSAPVTVAQGGTGANTASGARTALGVAIGTDVLAPNGSGANLTSLNASSVSAGTLALANGGTGANTATAAFNALNPMTTTGDMLYEASPTTAARLAIGSSGQILTVSGGIPTWATPASGGVTSLNGETGAIVNTDFNDIGSYILSSGSTASQTFNPSSTYSGSIIYTLQMNGTGSAFYYGLQGNAATRSGTWRMMGGGGAYAPGNCSTTYSGGVLFVRVS